LFIALAFSAFGTAIVFFLFYTQSINFYHFSSYILTQAAFFVGVFAFRSSEQKALQTPRYVPQNFYQLNVCFFFFFLVTFVCQLIAYKMRGIPLFLPSRLEAYIGGSGVGILSRVTDISLLCTLLCYYFLLANREQTRITGLHHLCFLVLITFLILSGSKSAFLNLVFCLFCLLRFYPSLRETTKNVFPFSLLRHKLLLFTVGAVFALIIIAVEKNETPLNPLQELGLRFISSGDIYYMAYPNNVYKLIDNSHGFRALFMDFLGFSRIYPWNELPQAIGLDLIKYHHTGDIIWGPNARHNVFGLIYFGYGGSVLFSLIIGTMVGFFRNKLLSLSGCNFFFFLLYSLFYIKIAFMETDPMLCFTYLNNVVFVFSFLFMLFLVIYDFAKRKKEIPSTNEDGSIASKTC
jgi:hypothetical protein